MSVTPHKKVCQYSIDSSDFVLWAETLNKDYRAIALRFLDSAQVRCSMVDNRKKYEPPEEVDLLKLSIY